MATTCLPSSAQGYAHTHTHAHAHSRTHTHTCRHTHMVINEMLPSVVEVVVGDAFEMLMYVI